MPNKSDAFVGREKELKKLHDLTTRSHASFIVIKGRRRVGKSRLVEEFAKEQNYLKFTGLAPTKETTAQSQRSEFARQLAEQVPLPQLAATDWGDLFSFLGSHTANQEVIILLDEISWMGSKDPDFLGKLKVAWDSYFSQNNKLILIICGSISSWIEKNIISSTGFFGRIVKKITLEPLSLIESNALLQCNGFKPSAYERFLVLAMTGGIPWYLELIQGKYPALENIRQLCFEKDGVLYEEFNLIFHDLFGKRSDIYQKIVFSLKDGPREFDQIASSINYAPSGQLTQYLDDLTQAGFISRDYTWHLTDAQPGKLSRFRLSDNYLRFFLRAIYPNRIKIERNQIDSLSTSDIKAFDSIMGLQFENLVLANTRLLFEKLGIALQDIDIDGAFFQNKTKEQAGCQIDYLIQTKQKTLYLFEIKFSRKPLGMSVITEVDTKINNLKKPKHLSVLPVLIHVGGVNDAVIEADYFYQILDFTDFLAETK